MNSAIFSLDKKYRYFLTRQLEEDTGLVGHLAFVMLNPSTADEQVDDPTIRRCKGFATELGYTGIVVANLYGYRSTSPSALKQVEDPIGPDNDDVLKSIAKLYDTVVFAFGGNPPLKRVQEVYSLFKPTQVYCLGVTKSGMPRHPLYLKKDSNLVPWSMP